MKLFIVAPFEAHGRYKGGISTVVNSLYDSQLLQEKGVEVIKYNTCRINRTNSKEASINAKNLKNFFCLYNSLPKELRKEKPDIVYYHTSIGMAFLKDLTVIKRIKKDFPEIKLVLHIHFAEYEKIMPRKPALERLTLALLANNTDKIIFLSKKTQKEFISHGIEAKKTAVVYNFSTITPRKNAINFKSDELTFLFVGSISQRKGIFDIISAFKEVPDKYRYRIHICGDFLTQKEKEEYSASIDGIQDNVVFHGFVSGKEKEQVFLNSDVLILPSYSEGLPVVILEAYSAGCAVITSNVGAIPEIVGKENGLLVEPGDIKALKESIEDYLTKDKNTIAKQKMLNYEISKSYSIQTFADKVYNICFCDND